MHKKFYLALLAILMLAACTKNQSHTDTSLETSSAKVPINTGGCNAGHAGEDCPGETAGKCFKVTYRMPTHNYDPPVVTYECKYVSSVGGRVFAGIPLDSSQQNFHHINITRTYDGVSEPYATGLLNNQNGDPLLQIIDSTIDIDWINYTVIYEVEFFEELSSLPFSTSFWDHVPAE